MKNKFINQLASDVLKQNHHWKDQYIKVQNKLKDFQSEMLQALQQSGYHQFNGILDPYQILKIFCKKLTKNQQNNQLIQNQNTQIKAQNNKLIQSSKKLNQQLEQVKARFKGLQLQFDKLDNDYMIKIKVTEERIQKLKQTRQKNHAQIQFLRRKNQNAVAQIIAHNRQKMHDLLLSHKNQMMQYRKTVQQDAWKMQSALRGQIDIKNQQIRKLIGNIDRLKKADKILQKDWAILESLMKPYHDHAALIQKLSELRKQVSIIKGENRNQLNKYLQLEMQNSSLKNQLQILKTKNVQISQKFQQAFNQNQKNKQQIEKHIEDKDKLTKYYDDKWIQQFNQVRVNLQKKFGHKGEQLQKQYKQKKLKIEQQSALMIQQNKKLKTQMQQMKQRTIEAQKKTQSQIKLRFNLMDKIKFLKMNIKQSQRMFHEDLIEHIQRQKRQIAFLQCQIQDLQYQIKQKQQIYQTKLTQKQSQHKATLFQLNLQKQEQKTKLKQQIVKLQQQRFKKQVQIKKYQIDQLKINQQIRIQYQSKLDKKLQLQRERCKHQIQQKIAQNKQNQNKLWQRIRQNQQRQKQIQLQKQQLKGHYQEREDYLKKLIQDKDRIIDQSKQQIASINNIKQLFLNQIQTWKNKVNDCEVQIKSLAIMIQSKQAQIFNLNIQLKQIIREKQKWNKMLKNSKIQFQAGFKQIKENCDKLINFYKGRVWEMQRMLQRQPISQKDYDRIKSLTDQNKKLENKIEMKQAQNLILQQIKQYYENKVNEAQISIGFDQQANNSKSVFVKRPKRRQGLMCLKQAATQRSVIFDNKEVNELKRYIKSRQKQADSQRVLRRPKVASLQQRSESNSRHGIKSSLV